MKVNVLRSAVVILVAAVLLTPITSSISYYTPYNTTIVPRAPFRDADAVKKFLQTLVYNQYKYNLTGGLIDTSVVNDSNGVATGGAYNLDFYGYMHHHDDGTPDPDMMGMMSIPTRTNSGKWSTFANAWMALFHPWIHMPRQTVIISEVYIGGNGYKLAVKGSWSSGKIEGEVQLPDGSKLDVTGKSFTDGTFAIFLTFDETTTPSRVIAFEGLYDVSEMGRLMGSPEYAQATAAASIYPAL